MAVPTFPNASETWTLGKKESAEDSGSRNEISKRDTRLFSLGSVSYTHLGCSVADLEPATGFLGGGRGPFSFRRSRSRLYTGQDR